MGLEGVNVRQDNERLVQLQPVFFASDTVLP
jgi:hypothetical protein